MTPSSPSAKRHPLPSIDPARVRRAAPELVQRRFLFWRRVRPEVRKRIEDRVARAPAQAALVLSQEPLVVGAYCAEIDTVVLLQLPQHLAADLGPAAGEAGLDRARRLVTLNRLRPIEEGFASDLDPGPEARGLHGDVVPFLADLVCAPGPGLDALRAEVPADEWERCRRFGQQLLSRDQPRRDGRPFRSERHGLRGVDPLAAEVAPEAESAPPRRRRWWLRLLLLLGALSLGVVGFYAYAQHYLRHVPYTIPPALRAPEPGADALLGRGLRLRYLGTAGFEVSDGKTTIWIDPVPTRPTIDQLISGPLAPDRAAQQAMELRYADAILVNHGHFDHVLDVPELALRTGATVVGTESVLNLCRSRGVREDRLVFAEGGRAIQIGSFKITPYASAHGPIGPIENPMGGLIPADAQQLWYWEYTQDGTRSYRLEAQGTSVYVSAGSPLPPGEEFLSGGRIGPTGTVTIGLAGRVPQANLAAFLAEVKPARLIANHYDNFFHPLSKGLALMPGGTSPEAFAEQVHALDPQAKVYALDYGQRLFVPPDGE